MEKKTKKTTEKKGKTNKVKELIDKKQVNKLQEIERKDNMQELQEILQSGFMLPERTEKNKHYQTGEKALAIAFLDASQREFNGEMIPRYTEVGLFLNIPEVNLRNWWKYRGEIVKQAQTQLSAVNAAVILNLSEIMLKMVNSLNQMDMNTLNAKDWSFLFSTVVTKLRLLSGQSTGNIAVKHSGDDLYVGK